MLPLLRRNRSREHRPGSRQWTILSVSMLFVEFYEAGSIPSVASKKPQLSMFSRNHFNKRHMKKDKTS